MIVDPDFCDHWKTRMLVGLLDGDEAAPVYVLRIWAHCQNRRQGQFENLPPEALKALCRFPGHSNKLEASLATSGFIRREGDSIIICNWEEYNASLIAAWKNGGRGGRPKTKTEPTNDNEKPLGKPRGLRVEKSRADEIEKSEIEKSEREKPTLAVDQLKADGLLPESWTNPETIAALREYCEWVPRNDQHGRPIDCVTLRSRLSQVGSWTADRLRRSLTLTMGLMRADKIFDADKPPPKSSKEAKPTEPIARAKRISEL